jgi:Phosphodiester glycosidase
MRPPIDQRTTVPIDPVEPGTQSGARGAPPQWPVQLRRGIARRAGRSRLPRGPLRVIVAALLVITLVVGTFAVANGAFGAQSADLMRAVLGPRATAQVESWYLNLQDLSHRVQAQLTGDHTAPPWQVHPTDTPNRAFPTPAVAAMPLPDIAPMNHLAASGAGVWTTYGVPQAAPGQPPIVAKTYVLPDAARPYAVVTFLQFDLRYTSLHLVAGTTQPGGPLHHFGPGAIPLADQQGNALVAAFNGGFKYADGHYGMMVNGQVYVPPVPGAATIAITREGQVLMGAWGSTPQLTSTNTDLVAWRQNASLLVDNGQLNPLSTDGIAWGGTYLDKAYTWRSALGLTNHGTLIYAAGNAVSAATLGRAMLAAGAITAMQTDINPFWVRAFLYTRDSTGALQTTKLDPAMAGSATDYFHGMSRDFFYLTRSS